MLELIFHLTRLRGTFPYLASRLFSTLVYPFSSRGISVGGEKQVKKTLAALLLMGMPAVALAMQPVQDVAQEPANTGSATAKSHHSAKHHRRSRNAHHKSAKRHHTAKQHPQAQ
jgi:hypothetical protein